MQHCVFVHRNWHKDQQLLTDTLQHFHHIQYPPHLLIFPEGTDLSEHNRRRDQSYADQKGLCRYEYVMHPHTTGFIHCARQLARNGKIRVCDVTVGYLGAMPQNERSLLAGKPILTILFYHKLETFGCKSSSVKQNITSRFLTLWYDHLSVTFVIFCRAISL